jgi:hypothetical protein
MTPNVPQPKDLPPNYRWALTGPDHWQLTFKGKPSKVSVTRGWGTGWYWGIQVHRSPTDIVTTGGKADSLQEAKQIAFDTFITVRERVMAERKTHAGGSGS